LEIFWLSVLFAHSKLDYLSSKVDTDADGLFSLSLEAKLLDECKLLDDFIFVLSEENGSTKNSISDNHSCWHNCYNWFHFGVVDSYNSESYTSNIWLEHLNTEVDFTEELDQSHKIESKNNGTDRLSINWSNNTHWHLWEHEHACYNLKSHIITLECTLSPALSRKFFNWWKFDLVWVFLESQCAVGVT